MDDSLPDLNIELQQKWAESQLDTFFEIVSKQLREPIRNYLMDQKNFGLSQADADDCISQVVAKLIRKSKAIGRKKRLDFPKTYIWRGCINAATDLKRNERKRGQTFSDRRLDIERYRPEAKTQAEADQAEKEQTEDPVGIAEDTAEKIISALAPDALPEDSKELPSHWAAPVIERALKRLTPKLRSVIELLITFGFDYDAEKGAQVLGLRKAGTFRERKRRGYRQLMQFIPIEMRALGINPPSTRIEEAIFEERPELGAVDDELGDG